MRAPNVLTISPALPFLETFVAAFLEGTVVPGFAAAADPLALSDATIYVPTRRAAAALKATFLRTGGRSAILLPRILPLGALEATETDLLIGAPADAEAGLSLPRVARPIWRQLRLAALIQRWTESLRGALCSVDRAGKEICDDREAFRVATSAVDAFALAGDLAGLIDEMLIEDVAWRELDSPRMADFDDYWRITTTFLGIAIDLWPKVLAERGLVDPATRQIALADALALALREGEMGDPVVAIGSTGTNKATARLLAAIARAPQGAVVLPGLDLELEDEAWTLVSGRREAEQEPSLGHPQAAMARLLPILGIERRDVAAVGTPKAAAAARARFVAEALRPADTTDRWRAYRRKVPDTAVAAAIAGISLIEAADEREEALCLAIALREILETPGRTGALVTPDREMARRVRGELLRWDIEVEDSGGEPLSARPLGILARLVAAASVSRMAARDVGALLTHPLAAVGRPRSDTARLASLLEIAVLRTVTPGRKNADRLFDLARKSAADTHAHPAQKAIKERDWTDMRALWRDLETALAPLLALAGPQDLAHWIAAHRQAVAAIASVAAKEETDALEAVFDELAADAGPALRFNAEGYAILFGRLAAEIALPNTEQPHARLAVYGLLEARLMRADVMLLGGLDETIWPPQAKADAFLNRPMRAELGLSPPERRIGQTAHDFVQAMGNDTIILSRARKRGGAPCVTSRFLLRLEALGGKAWDACRTRGRRYVELARVLDSPQKAPVPVARPRPCPPVSLRPGTLSVTQIETLRRDPYSIYAAHILRLAPLPRSAPDLDAAAIGSLMHEALHAFALSNGAGGDAPTRRAALEAIVRELSAGALEDPSFEALRWPMIEKAMDVFLAFDSKQRQTLGSCIVEARGQLVLTLADQSPFTLHARADRIDFHRDGAATLIDYKTGRPPGKKEVQVGFAPQLTLEAAILRGGGFDRVHEVAVGATYLKLGGKDGGRERALTFDNESFSNVVDRHFEGLHLLLSSFRHPDAGYPSRPFPKYARDHGDYDHLARLREWSLVAADEMPP